MPQVLVGFAAFMMDTETASPPWDATLDAASVLRNFSPEAADEVRALLGAHPAFNGMTDLQTLESVALDPEALPTFMEDIRAMREEAWGGNNFVVIQPVEGLSLEQQMAVPWLIGQVLGHTLVQNQQGHRYYIITDRGGRIEEGARYSQTSQGGSFHTDGVNQKDNYEFMVLHCVVPAAEGGDSILLDGRMVYDDLRENAPPELEVLQQDFLWEYKGVRPGEFYHEPILRLVEGNPQWRYLRDYIEEAARLCGEPLSAEAMAALDRLDESLANPAFQFRFKLDAGQTAVVRDRSVFHGRNPFRDAPGTVSIEERLAAGLDVPLKRTYCRIWVNP